MNNTVFILGAGASKTIGIPLMDEFLDIANDLWSMDVINSDDEDFKNVFEVF